MNTNHTLGSVLVVDDSERNLAVACTILRKAGYDPRPAVSGLRALELAAAETPDLVLLDVSMPGMDGYETCARLKSDDKTRDIPVIFLTAAGTSSENVIQGFEAGAVDYITKPVVEKILVSRVGVHIRLRKIALDLAERNRAMAEEITARDRILYVLSHDLKNSFFGARDGAAMLDSDWDTMEEPLKRRFVYAIRESSERSAKLLLSVLEWSKAEIANQVMSFSELEPGTVISEVAEVIQQEADKKNISVEVLVEPGIPCAVTDRFALAAILRNLASNACKFTPEGGLITLSAGKGPDTIVFVVQDTGIGLESAQAAGLTGNFVRSKAGTAGESGTGLGLLICGMLASRIGCVIVVDREKTSGTRIAVSVPLFPQACRTAIP
jgi:two-component system sensor histidine kinase/response regulator